jgi:hypothetical protein
MHAASEELSDSLCMSFMTPNEVRAAVGLTEIGDDHCGTQILYADNEPIMVIEDKPSPIRRPTPIPGYITH